MIKQEQIVAHLEQYGFIYQSSKIYNGLSNSWDFGPLGVLLKNSLKDSWWRRFVLNHPLNVGLDSALILNPLVWKASGHIDTFHDPLIDCKSCHSRFRADKLIEDQLKENIVNEEKMNALIQEKKIVCPICKKSDFTPIRNFSLMFKTFLGPIEESKSVVYLRPETAQGIFINFKNIQRSTRKKLPFGVGQIGKSFRNEITPGNFIFRVREFEQAELEFFCTESESDQWYQHYIDEMFDFYLSLGIRKENLRIREHEKEELSHYSKATSDIEYKFKFGWGEVCGIANRTDYDLKAHSNSSVEVLDYFNQEDNTRFFPYVIEPSLGIERLFLAVVSDSLEEEVLENGESRIVMKIHKSLAPIKVAVLPLSKNLKDGAHKIFLDLSKLFKAEYDESQSIGKRYRRQDAIGTPFCITYDFDSVNDGMVTIRERDSMKQERIKISDLADYLKAKLS